MRSALHVVWRMAEQCRACRLVVERSLRVEHRSGRGARERRNEVAAGRIGHRRGDGEPAKQCRTVVPSRMTLEGV
jgi:hypothetical protein